MKIGFDAKRIVANGTGLGSYGRNLVNALSQTDEDSLFHLYAPHSGRENLRCQVNQSPNVEFVYSSKKVRVMQDWWRSRGIVKDLIRDNIELYHGLSGELPKGLKKSGVKGLMTVHDLIFFRHPEWYHAIDVWLYKRKFYASLKEADRIIAISERTKQDILAFSNYPENRIEVIYQSCSTWFRHQVGEDRLQEIHAQYDLPTRYLLSVGTVEERKNLGLVIEALPEISDECHLVIVGRQTPYATKIKQRAEELGIAHRVHFLQGVPNEDLPGIYQMAECFVYPSRYEGFGIPIIEAIQSGLPVVAATGSCLEEAGGPDCLYVDPDDAHGMAIAVGQLLIGTEGREERIQRSQEYIRKFENKDVASQVLQLYHTMIES